MEALIKEIRKIAGMSQAQFADTLGTTALSVNRWENGKSLPNKMAQKNLYLFCKERGIDLSRMIIQSKEYNYSSDKVILYHGSKKGICGEIAPVSRSACDFGPGFYMGTTALQSLTLVCNEENPVFYTLELDLSGLKVLNMEIGIEWAMLIAYNRKEMESAKGTELYKKYQTMTENYDIITGFIADDRMYTELSRFFNRTLTDTALIHCLSALDLGKQYVAVSEKACRQIKILKEEMLSPFELAILKDMSIVRRKEGIALTEEIEIKYRREGKYFDEILRGE